MSTFFEKSDPSTDQLEMFETDTARPARLKLTGAALGEELKREGIKRVLENSGSWSERALLVVKRLAETKAEFTADDIREAVERDVGPPHHSNAWGAMTRTAAGKKRAWIELTNRVEKSTRAAAHSHRNPIWRSRIYKGARA